MIFDRDLYKAPENLQEEIPTAQKVSEDIRDVNRTNKTYKRDSNIIISFNKPIDLYAISMSDI